MTGKLKILLISSFVSAHYIPWEIPHFVANDILFENADCQLGDHLSLSLLPPSQPSPKGEGAKPPFPPWGK